MQIFVLGAAVVLWALVHSVLASMWMKALAKRVFGAGFAGTYRLGYNVFALVSLGPIAWLMWRLPDRLLYAAATPWSIVMLGVQGMAVILAAVTLLQTNVLHFAGLAQALGSPEDKRLVTTGFYRVVRHPLYLFGLIFLWFSPQMSLNQLALGVLLTLYLFVGAFFEERRLVEEFGAVYKEYRSKTPMIVPGLR